MFLEITKGSWHETDESGKTTIFYCTQFPRLCLNLANMNRRLTGIRLAEHSFQHILAYRLLQQDTNRPT